jgi:hypothetical protein
MSMNYLYVNNLFKKIWVMDRVFNFWKVESLDNQYFRPLSKMSIISVELLKII